MVIHHDLANRYLALDGTLSLSAVSLCILSKNELIDALFLLLDYVRGSLFSNIRLVIEVRCNIFRYFELPKYIDLSMLCVL